MSKEINSVISELCNRLGTSAKLLIPEIAKLRIAESAILLAAFLALLIVSLCLLPKAWKYDHKVVNGYRHDLTDSCFSVIPAGSAVIGLIGVTVQAIELVEWLVSPTAKAILVIANMIK